MSLPAHTAILIGILRRKLVAASGGGGGSAPFILFTDFSSGPTAGNVSNSGDENSKGCYLSVYGINFGSFASYGTSNLVTVGGVTVDNYRCLEAVVAPAMAALGVMRLTVQVGALSGLSNGTAYPVSVSVASVTPSNSTSGGNYLDIDGEALTFTPQPGPIYFVDFVNGSNGNAGTFAAPFKDLQTTAGTGGAFKKNTTQNGTDGIHPGAHVVARTGTYTNVGQNDRAVDLMRITGRPATGASDRGSICFTSYPGAAGANSPELCHIQLPTAKGGGFNGNDSTRAQEISTSFGGFTGWCQYMEFSNFKVTSNPTGPSDGGCMNAQSTARHWRLVNLELIWQSTVTGASHAKSGGVEGSLLNSRIYGLYIHDVNGDTGANENHGVYLDGNIDVSTDVIVAYCTIKNIGAGNGIQTYDGINGAGMDQLVIHHNWIETVNKNCLNIVDNTKGCKAYNNILLYPGENAIRLSTDSGTAANCFIFANNVIYMWDRIYTAATRFAFADESNLGTGAASGRFENNICMQPAAGHTTHYDWVYLNSGKVTVAKNRWYDAGGTLTSKPSEDSTGSYGNPNFTSAGTDFTLATGSACINAGNTPTGITRSFGFGLNTAPQGAAHDQGAFERA